MLFVLILSQYCCHPTDNKRTIDTKVFKSTVLVNDSIFNGHPLTFYINHDKIPQVCKDLFSGVRQPSDEIDVLSLLDSIFTTNDETRPFYFLTITRTMEKADGAYAEPLGMMGKQFVEIRTKEFVDYFNKEILLTDKDFEEWAKKVAGEIEISADGKEKEELEKLRSKMKLNCQSCDEGQSKILNDFVERVAHHCP